MRAKPDKIIGVIVRKDLIDVFAEGRAIDVRALVKPAPVVLDRADALAVLRRDPRLAGAHGAGVRRVRALRGDRHARAISSTPITGGFQRARTGATPVVQRDDGSWLVPGSMPVDEFAERLGVPIPKDPQYETVAGFVLAELNHLPVAGESFSREPWRFEVVDLDARRIDKLLVSKAQARPGCVSPVGKSNSIPVAS